jgi:uncharacterized delta-60 repeat protein/uncharacterized repeat protein (TIGR01451 family)
VALQENGKILASGSALVRYNLDGTLDSTFGTGGRVIGDSFRALALQEDGKIVAAGSNLARYTTSGALDNTFGTGGKVITGFLSGGVTLQVDGKIVAAGGSGENFVVARYMVEADLSLNKTGPPGRVPTGRNMTYTLTVANNAPDVASEVNAIDQLPPTVSFVSAAPRQGSCSESAGTVICSLGSMANGAVAMVDIVVTPNSAGTVTNTASVSAITLDPNEINNTDSVATSICRITSRRTSIPCG